MTNFIATSNLRTKNLLKYLFPISMRHQRKLTNSLFANLTTENQNDTLQNETKIKDSTYVLVAECVLYSNLELQNFLISYHSRD